MQAELIIDLNAIANNWRWMNAQTSPSCDCGAVVKANAYGLGMAEVIPTLQKAGCQSFYVSNLQEGLALQALLGRGAKRCRIFVLTGCAPGEELAFIQSPLIPVIISLEMFQRWWSACRDNTALAVSHTAAIKVDTGMGRMGLSQDELDTLCHLSRERSDFCAAGIKYVFSHLACADEPGHPLNARQLAQLQRALQQLRTRLPGLIVSFANSAGILLGEAFHFDLVRPGISLYGGQPIVGQRLPLETVVSLHLPVIQLRRLPPGQSVGYGATRQWSSARLIAVVKSGYADGLTRGLSNAGSGVLLPAANTAGVAPREVPIVGRVSMDTLLFDVTDCPVSVGDVIEILGPHKTLESLAQQANAFHYEVLTSLGGRYARTYLRGEC